MKHLSQNGQKANKKADFAKKADFKKGCAGHCFF